MAQSSKAHGGKLRKSNEGEKEERKLKQRKYNEERNE
jgi:hypothetical protein